MKKTSISPVEKYERMTTEELSGLNYVSWFGFNKYQLRDIAKRYNLIFRKSDTKDDLADMLYNYFKTNMNDEYYDFLSNDDIIKSPGKIKGKLKWKTPSPPNYFKSSFQNKSKSPSPSEPKYERLSKEDLLQLNQISWYAFNKKQLRDIADRFKVSYVKENTKDQLSEILYDHFKNLKWKEQIDSLFEIPYQINDLEELNWIAWHTFTLEELKIIANKYKIPFDKNLKKEELVDLLFNKFQSGKNKGMIKKLLNNIF
jgi:hypothetical protein